MDDYSVLEADAETVARWFGVDPEAVRRTSKPPLNVGEARRVLCWMAVRHRGLKLVTVAQWLGRHHSTVHAAVASIDAVEASGDWTTSRLVAELLRQPTTVPDQSGVCETCPARSMGGGRWCLSCFPDESRKAVAGARHRPERGCGTDAGARQHYRRKEPVCEPCRRAHNWEQRERRERREAS